jgi:hypothetical protein
MIEAKDIRNLNRIVEKIKLFFEDKIQFYPLVDDLSALSWDLETPDTKWAECFYPEWGELEIIRALAQENNNKYSNEDTKLVFASLKKMLFLTEKFLKEEATAGSNSQLPLAKALNKTWVMCPLCQESMNNPTRENYLRCPSCLGKIEIRF